MPYTNGFGKLQSKIETKVGFNVRKKKNIVLIGMTGCGKTTVGLSLSYRLKMPFIDMDAWIEKEAGISIPQIFQEEGEEGFRKRETQMAEKMSHEKGTIVSTGGGIVTREENMQYLKQNSVVVYINRSVEDIIKNLRMDKRPMLKGKTDTLYPMYEKRHPLYLKYADIEVINDGDFESGVENVLNAVKGRI